jgi:hypothetical protein
VCRARLTTSEWRLVGSSCSLTPYVLDCRSAQPKSANDDEHRARVGDTVLIIGPQRPLPAPPRC